MSVLRMPSIERPQVDVKYPNRRALATCAIRRMKRVELFVPASLDYEDRTAIRLRVILGDTARNFYIGGRATPASRGSDHEGGFFLVIEESADLRAFQHLWNFCTGIHHEQARRYPASIACVVKTATAAHKGRIVDVSMSGAFVALDEPGALAPGATVQLSVRHGFLHLLRQDVPAHLVWHGEKAGTPGIGAEFADGAQAGLGLLRGQVYRAK